MKRQVTLTVVLILLLSTVAGAQAELVWEKDSIAVTPESIVYDSKRECCYISRYNRANGDGTFYNEDYVSKFDLKGVLLEKKMVPNLTSPTGLYLFDDKLYITERFGIVKYDLASGTVERRYRVKSDKFLNDVAVDANENIYVTVSDTNIIYRISDGEVETWYESPEIMNPNGITVDGDNLIVGICSMNTLKSIALSDKKIADIAKMEPEYGVIDGVKKCGDGYMITHFRGVISLVNKDGTCKEILDLSEEGNSCADFEYIENEQLMVIPDLTNSKVLLYKYLPEE
jgi:sugar lactone lactonase YvrE